MFYTYILRCGDQSLYTGYTVDIDQRLKKHGEGKASKYTRSRLPVQLVYVEAFNSKSEAMKREAAIKKMSKRAKEKLVECGHSHKV
ncbi:GIY-YIG nuclease family protein [Bacillaceae bacterium W0354]